MTHYGEKNVRNFNSGLTQENHLGLKVKPKQKEVDKDKFHITNLWSMNPFE